MSYIESTILLTQIRYTEMFDMLDDDLDLGYVPSVPTSKSRAGSMKKMTKKEPKAPKAQPKINYNKVNEFDDLLDDILEKQSKNVVGFGDNKSTTNNNASKTVKDSFDFFDDPKPKSQEKNKLVIKDESPPSPTRNRFKMQASDEIISDEPIFKNISKPSLTSGNTSKIDKIDEEPIFASSRNMKPPLRKKDSQTSITPPASSLTGGGGLSLNVPEQPNKLVIGGSFGSNKDLDKKQDNDDIIRPPPRLMGRRPSADKNKDIEESNYSLGLSLAPEPKQIKKEESSKARGLFLTMEEPKNKKKQEDSPFFSFSKQKQSKPSFSLGKESIKQPLKIDEPKPVFQKPKQEIRMQPPPHRSDLGLRIDQSMTMKDSAMPQINIRTTKTEAYNSEDYDRQIDLMKGAFQKQIDFLQQNLEKQITINRQTRQKIIQDSNKMIEDQRNRSKRMYDEELTRQKEMFEWQRKRIEQNYQSQIASLKQSLEFANKNTQNSSYKTSSNNKEDVEYLQMQLRNQKRILDDRQKMVDKRQRQLQERQQQLTKRRKRQDDRIRDEQRKLYELQSKIKKQSMDDKKCLSEEKQKMAIELANLEVEARRRMEKADIVLRQNRMMRQSLQKQKTELRLANAELMNNYKSKYRQIQQERQRIQRLQEDLVKKLRIVQLKSRQVSRDISTANINKTYHNRKQNNWLDEKSASQLRSMSVQKQNNAQKYFEQVKQTKDRFSQLQYNTSSKMSIPKRQNRKINIENYMLTVDQYNKIRQHA